MRTRAKSAFQTRFLQTVDKLQQNKPKKISKEKNEQQAMKKQKYSSDELDEDLRETNQKKQQKKSKQNKPKKEPKPKKYLKKNIQQVSRIARSRYQKIYLLEAQRQEEGIWSFLVQGTSGSNYHVQLHYTGLKCTCPDFRINQKPCKHIYFIVTQVAQNLEILDYFNNSLKISKSAFTVLDKQLSKRLQSRMQKPEDKEKGQIDLKDDTDCTICFTEMNKATEVLEGCHVCVKYFHFECLQAWKKQNPSCPLCRSKFRNVLDSDDPLGKLKTIQINSQSH